MLKRNSRKLATLGSAILLCAMIEKARAVEIEPWPKAVMAIVKTGKPEKKTDTIGGKPVEMYYGKGKDGKPTGFIAFIEKGLYAPDCTHTWAIAIDAKSGKVAGIRPIEMKCNHAFPCKAPSFLDQYKGKGPADAAKLESQINTIAKATGSSNLTTDAVKHAIVSWQKMKSKL